MLKHVNCVVRILSDKLFLFVSVVPGQSRACLLVQFSVSGIQYSVHASSFFSSHHESIKFTQISFSEYI